MNLDIAPLNLDDSIHSGTTKGDVMMNFGRAERARYRKYIFLAAFSSL